MFDHDGRFVVVLRVHAVAGQSVADAHALAGTRRGGRAGGDRRARGGRGGGGPVSVERAPAADLLARADDWLEQTRADGELRAGWSRPTDAVLVLGSAQRAERAGSVAASLDGRRSRLLRRPLPHARRRAAARPPPRDRRRRPVLPLAGAGAAGGARGARREAARRDAA